MEVTTHYAYDPEKGLERIDAILNSDVSQITEKSAVQPRKYLTYLNGYFVRVTSLYIDIIGADDMSDKHRSTTLAKINRSFISECYALLMSEQRIREIKLFGDCIWAIFDTPLAEDVDAVVRLVGRLNTLLGMLNAKLKKKRYSELSVGIGLDAGRALMAKAGFSGSGINDVIWIGDAVNASRVMAESAGKNGVATVLVSERVALKLDSEMKKEFQPVEVGKAKYYGANILCPFKDEGDKADDKKGAEKKADDKKAPDKKAEAKKSVEKKAEDKKAPSKAKK